MKRMAWYAVAWRTHGWFGLDGRGADREQPSEWRIGDDHYPTKKAAQDAIDESRATTPPQLKQEYKIALVTAVWR